MGGRSKTYQEYDADPIDMITQGTDLFRRCSSRYSGLLIRRQRVIGGSRNGYLLLFIDKFVVVLAGHCEREACSQREREMRRSVAIKLR